MASETIANNSRSGKRQGDRCSREFALARRAMAVVKSRRHFFPTHSENAYARFPKCLFRALGNEQSPASLFIFLSGKIFCQEERVQKTFFIRQRRILIMTNKRKTYIVRTNKVQRRAFAAKQHTFAWGDGKRDCTRPFGGEQGRIPGRRAQHPLPHLPHPPHLFGGGVGVVPAPGAPYIKKAKLWQKPLRLMDRPAFLSIAYSMNTITGSIFTKEIICTTECKQ